LSKYVYFFREREKHGYISNWYKSDMVIDSVKYSCVEQYMMHQKALLFEDYYIADLIINTKAQKEIKALGRQVRNFNEAVWVKHRFDIVKRGVIGKFMCNDKLMVEFLKHKPGTVFVECPPWDTIWGIGVGIEDRRRLNEKNWRGMNLLGKVLKEVRIEMESW